MGKTSLVRKAISEIKGNHYYALSRHVRLFLFLIIVYLFGRARDINPELFFLLLFFINALTVWYLVWHDQNRPNLNEYYKKRFIAPPVAKAWNVIKSIFQILDPEADYYKRSKFKTLLQDVFIASVIYLVFSMSTSSDLRQSKIFDSISWLLLLSLIHFLLVYIVNNYQLELVGDPDKSRAKSIVKAFKRIFVNAVLRLDYGNKATIEISLSQDDLKEIDILKLLAKNVFSGYKNIRNRVFAPNRVILPIIKFATVYIITGLLYFHAPIYDKINDFRLNSSLVQYLPSQAIFPGTESNEIDTTQTIAQFLEHVNQEIEEYFLDYYRNDSLRILVRVPFDTLLTKKILGNQQFLLDSTLMPHVLRPADTSVLFQEIAKRKSIGRDAVNNSIIQIPQVADYDEGSVRHWAITTDFIFQVYYHSIMRPFIFDPLGSSRTSTDFRFLPQYIDYFFFFTILSILGLISLVERNAWRVGLVNHSYVLRRLKNLNDNIAAQIVHDQGQSTTFPGVGLKQVFNVFNRKTRTYPIAGVREIENELIDILDEIDRIPAISTRPEFIFIFDELDKIEAQYNANIQEKEREELTSFSDEDEGYFSTESIRRRQETIARILGNLKLFFNTAKAKFIFIAGREMYDASLADISDRESFISSIFHEIIYVESFFKDAGSEGSSNITSTTEEFVCQLLMPRFSRYEKNLKGFNSYLLDNFSENRDPIRMLKKWINKNSLINEYAIAYHEDDEAKKNRQKIIYTLEQFITFLTYRGNGAPKKITKLLEGFIVDPSDDDLTDPNQIVAGRSNGNLYLCFDFTAQYRLGLTSYLFKPYLIANTSHMRDFGDKMLIATSFLMDHLYKYHKVGFSWENLELTPEIIAINKSPELRRYISRLIDFMANSHIEEIINGLYQFKFTIRIAAEIKYISTISEVEAAAFNFTLDESLLLKRHYRKKLKSMGKSFQSYRQNSGTADSQHIGSIAYINTILGDLHFYDREYDEALIHYDNAGQFLMSKKHNELQIDDFFFLIRHLLKVGLTHEKTKDYDSAFVVFGKLTQLIRDKINEESNDEDEQLRIRRKLFENVRLIFQPLLAQFQIMEKGGPNGVTMIDLVRVYDEFQIIIEKLEKDEKFLIETEFFNKMADLVYYKNGSLVVQRGKEYGDGLSAENIPTLTIFRTLLTENEEQIKEAGKLGRDFRAPFAAYGLYKRSITLFASKIDKLHDSHSNRKFIDDLSGSLKVTIAYLRGDKAAGYQKFKPNRQKELQVAIGGSLSDFADTLICFFTKEEKIDWVFLEYVLSPRNRSSDATVFRQGKILDNLYGKEYDTLQDNVSKVLYVMFLASQVFLRAGDYHRCLLQLKKILITLRRVLNYHVSNTEEKIQELSSDNYELVKLIGKEAINILDRSTSHTRQQQVYEWMNVFDENGSEEISNTSILNQPEAREILIIVKEIELYRTGADFTKLLSNSLLGSSTTVMNNRYNRVFELYYKCTLNYRNLKKVMTQAGIYKEEDVENSSELLSDLISGIEGLPELKKLKIEEPDELLCYLISDSIYCLTEVLRSFNVFGITYICNHSLNALIHDHLATWCSYYHRLKQLAKQDLATERFMLKLESSLDLYLGKIDLQYLDVLYHLKMGLQHCYSSMEMHQGGTAYKRAIEEMHYLDDDYDDNLSHFYAAEERYRINSGFVRSKIDSLKRKIEHQEKERIANVF